MTSKTAKAKGAERKLLVTQYNDEKGDTILTNWSLLCIIHSWGKLLEVKK